MNQSNAEIKRIKVKRKQITIYLRMFAGFLSDYVTPSTKAVEASINLNLSLQVQRCPYTVYKSCNYNFFTPVDFTGSPTDNTVLHFLKPKHSMTLSISYTQPELRQSPQSSRCLQLLKAKINVSNPHTYFAFQE